MRENFITIGSFDGVHLGHKHLLYVLKDLSARNGMKSAVLTFTVPPRAVINGAKEAFLITTVGEKFVLLKELGVDKIVKLDFEALRHKTCRKFFDSLLKDYNMGGVLAGRDFAFGKDRCGNADFLEKACGEAGVLYARADFVTEGGHKISSSSIRHALKAGDIAVVNKMLGRAYKLEGKIIKGRQLGRTIGFPTANMDTDVAKILPRGIFAVRVYLGAEVFKGVCNIGYRPTVSDTGLPSVEVHILDFNRDIYGRIMTADLIGKIRDEVRFASLAELKAQIELDAVAARNILP
jgi:riboflavin kinase/FMN adenylyltransferase